MKTTMKNLIAVLLLGCLAAMGAAQTAWAEGYTYLKCRIDGYRDGTKFDEIYRIDESGRIETMRDDYSFALDADFHLKENPNCGTTVSTPSDDTDNEDAIICKATPLIYQTTYQETQWDKNPRTNRRLKKFVDNTYSITIDRQNGNYTYLIDKWSDSNGSKRSKRNGVCEPIAEPKPKTKF